MACENWKITETIVCQQLTSDYLEDAITFMEKTFYPYENICKTMGIADDPETLFELKDLTRSAAKDGVSVIAIDTKTNKIVGAAFNKIQVNDDPVFENFAKKWKREKAQNIVGFMAYIDNLCNLFNHCKINCIFELMFVATSPEYKGKGIGKKVCEVSVELARKLVNGVNVKKSVDGTDLKLEPVPKICSAIFTSFITQKIGKSLGFKKVVEVNYADLDFAGLNFSEVAKTGTTKLTLEYLQL